MPKNSEVLFACRQLIVLLRSAHTRYIFPTLLIPVLRFFLKSKNLKSLMISPKSHTTVTLTELLSKLYRSIVVAKTPWRNGACRCSPKYSWAGLLGKMYSFQIPGEDWNLSTCLHSVVFVPGCSGR